MAHHYLHEHQASEYIVIFTGENSEAVVGEAVIDHLPLATVQLVDALSVVVEHCVTINE